MISLNPFKLEKLQIIAHENARRLGLPKSTFTVMFNPSTIETKHENVFQKLQGINTSGRANLFSHGRSESVTLDLVFDGTGVSQSFGVALPGSGFPSVARQVDDFLDACFRMDGKIHAPRHLTLLWGDGPLRGFECRMDRVTIQYTAFDRNGSPLRATLKTSFVEDLSPEKRAALENKSSPDLTHHRVVRRGDSLPMLCREIYGTPDPYLFVADANRLDDFRRLVPGQELVFPPLPVRTPNA